MLRVIPVKYLNVTFESRGLKMLLIVIMPAQFSSLCNLFFKPFFTQLSVKKKKKLFNLPFLQSFILQT